MNVSVTIGSISAALSGELLCFPCLQPSGPPASAHAHKAAEALLRAAHAAAACCADRHTHMTGPAGAHSHHRPGPAAALAAAAVCHAGVAGHAHRHWGDDYTSSALYVRIISMFMLATSILIAVWGGYNFNHRANMLQ